MIEFTILPALCAATILGSDADGPATQADKDAQTILAIERSAFERWAKGDLSGFLDASDPEVDYFDPFVTHWALTKPQLVNPPAADM